MLGNMLQRRLGRAYEDMGSAALRSGVTDDDFAYDSLLSTLAANNFGDVASPGSLRFALFREWPLEPATEPLETEPPDPYLRGHEGTTEVTQPISPEILKRDLRKWKREGQTWMGAFLKPAQIKVATFLRLNEAANLKAASAAAARRIHGAKNTSNRVAKFD